VRGDEFAWGRREARALGYTIRPTHGARHPPSPQRQGDGGWRRRGRWRSNAVRRSTMLNKGSRSEESVEEAKVEVSESPSAHKHQAAFRSSNKITLTSDTSSVNGYRKKVKDPEAFVARGPSISIQQRWNGLPLSAARAQRFARPVRRRATKPTRASGQAQAAAEIDCTPATLAWPQPTAAPSGAAPA
jgi:hypothetical protein